MKILSWRVPFLLCFLLLPCLLFAAEVQVGTFPPVDMIETELQRGVSTTGDVARVLGLPAGRGGYLAIMDGIPRDVWYYHDINASVIDTKDGVMRLHTHTQVLLIFFSRDRLDGYKWFSAAAAGRAK